MTLVLTMTLESTIYHLKFNIISILYKYSMNINQVEIYKIVLIKPFSDSFCWWSVKFAK